MSVSNTCLLRPLMMQELGYHIHCKVIDGAHFVPQHRERIIIVGFREPVAFDWDMLNLPEKKSDQTGQYSAQNRWQRVSAGVGRK